jgi:5-methylcytosine-specific restriction endonuclease McrA
VQRFACSHLADHALLREVASLLSQDHRTTAALLAHLAEVDARRLYASTRYDSMFAWCVGELHMSEGTAYKRVRAARVARQFPAVLEAVADGRLHLSAVVLLAPHLSPANAAELLAAAAHRSKAQVEQLVAERFPRPDVPTLVRPIPAAGPGLPASSLATAEPAMPAPASAASTAAALQLAPGPVDVKSEYKVGAPVAPAPAPVATSAAPTLALARARVTPLAPGRVAFQATLDRETLELLREAQDLLSHAIPGRAEADVLKRVLRDWVAAEKRRKYGLTDRPRARRAATPKGRHVPNAIKREVVRRDGGRCTFVGPDGRRCGSRVRLELDHVTPLARGGETSVANLRLRCRTHNQSEAEQVFGKAFMQRKRDAAAWTRGATAAAPSPAAEP